MGTTTRLKHSKASSNDWFKVFPNSRLRELFQEVFRVLKRNTHFYLMCDAETMFIAKPEAEGAGFRFWKPLVWDKRTIGMGYHYRARYEFILFFEKGKRRLNDLGIADVIAFHGPPRLSGGKTVRSRRDSDPAKFSTRRGRCRSVHGLRQRRCRCGTAWSQVSGERLESGSRAACSAEADKPGAQP